MMVSFCHITLLTCACMGAGGLGKSTLAKGLFNRLAGGFSHSAFVEIQADDGPSSIARHLSRVLKRLGGEPGSKDEAPELREKLQKYVRSRKVLFVLDNVWTGPQLDALLPAEWGAGSTVIVTSRFSSFTDSSAWPKVLTCMPIVHGCHASLYCSCSQTLDKI
jgi:hypothetical protein